MLHDFWTGAAPLLKRCNRIGCTHDSALGQDYHVFCTYAMFVLVNTKILKNTMLSDSVFTEGVIF